MMRIAINGFGRIGRSLFRQLRGDPAFEVVAINDLASIEELAYALRYDTVRGRFPGTIKVADGGMIIDGRPVAVTSIADPGSLPWKDQSVELVFECTGRLTNSSDLAKHILAGASFVILSAPAAGGDIPMVTHGVNRAEGQSILSCASCTTNAIVPVMEVLERRFGVLKAMMTTVHAYTADQSLVDSPRGNRRRGRAAAANLVPTATGAARSASAALPSLKDKFDGLAIRVPVPTGSIADITALLARPVTVEELNLAFRAESETDRYRGILGVTDDEIVSGDVVGDTHAALVDLTLTQVVGGDLVKLFSWYDNEWGYSAQLIRAARELLPSTGDVTPSVRPPNA